METNTDAKVTLKFTSELRPGMVLVKDFGAEVTVTGYPFESRVAGWMKVPTSRGKEMAAKAWRHKIKVA